MDTVKEGRALQAIILSVLLLALAASSSGQQNHSRKPTTQATSSCVFSDGKVIDTSYSRLHRAHRKIFGGIVPYADVWPTDGRQAPTFYTDADLTVGGQDVPAGNYKLFTIPNTDKWTLIFSKDKGETEALYSREDDLFRVQMKISKPSPAVEDFTIAYDREELNCTLKISWENTQASVDVTEKKLCWPTTTPLTYQCPDQ